MLGSLPQSRRSTVVSPEAYTSPSAAAPTAPRSKPRPSAAYSPQNDAGSGKFKRSIPWCAKPALQSTCLSRQPHDAAAVSSYRILVIITVALLINWNSSRTRIVSSGLGGAKTRDNIARGGYARFAGGGGVITAAAQQGASQCVSAQKGDTPTAQCQPFCSEQFKKFHCVWCKYVLSSAVP